MLAEPPAAARQDSPTQPPRCNATWSPSPFNLPFRDYARDGERCADGAHVVFVPVIPLASIVMRGMMPLSVLNSTRGQLHGTRVSYLTYAKTPNGSSSMGDRLEHHFSVYGRPSACIVIKYHDATVATHCKKYGAVVLLDCIDNHRCISAKAAEAFKTTYDGVIVQTRTHAKMLSDHGTRAIVQPHPHGDHKRKRVAHPLRNRLLSVGLIYGDAKNRPDSKSMAAICNACARMNATFYFINSPNTGMLRPPMKACSKQEPSQYACTHGDGAVLGERCQSEHIGHFRYRGNLSDVTGQHRFYDSPSNEKLKETIDVGLLWPPGHRKDSFDAVNNRPPTRMHWWWAQSIPVMAYPMPAYVEASERINYPASLVNLRTQEDIERALCAMHSRRSRMSLQRAVMRGAFLTTPLHAALELLTTICVVAKEANIELNRGAVTTGEDQLMTRQLIKGGG